MPAKFSVFYVEGYELRASTEGAAPLFQIARDAYQAACAADDIGQERLEEMVGACHWMLSALAAGNIAYPPFLDASDSDAEKLRDLVNQVVPGTDAYCWVELLPDGDELLPSQLLAAHTLHRLDVAATNLIEGSLSEALAALASASLGIADYSFLEGREDYRASERDTTTAHARASASATARMRALPAMKEYVRQRWLAGPRSGETWTSRNALAGAVTQEVCDLAKTHGWTMKMTNAQRTINEWLRHDKKRGS